MALDLEYMRANLHVSHIRRLMANLIDAVITLTIAWGLFRFHISPWWSLSYLLIRDCLPMSRSIGKTVTGIHILRFEVLTQSTFLQRLIRGLTNTIIIVPLGLIISTFIVLVFVLILFAGFILIVRGPSIFLEMIGYHDATGRMVSDRLARTHLVTMKELEVLRKTQEALVTLRMQITEKS